MEEGVAVPAFEEGREAERTEGFLEAGSQVEQTAGLMEAGSGAEQAAGFMEPESLSERIAACFLKGRQGTDAPEQYSPLVLAFIGDAVYSLVVRTIIVERGNMQVNKMHRAVSSLVKAQAQQKFFRVVSEKLTEEEMAVFKRGRNAKSHTSAKNASIVDYRIATGVEALVGYLYLKGDMERILWLMSEGLKDAVMHCDSN